MLNSNIQLALDTIKREYLKATNSTDRYTLMHNIQQELELIKKYNSSYVPGNKITASSLDQITYDVLQLVVEACDVSIDIVYKNINAPYSELSKEIKMDDLDWVELQLGLEELYDAIIPNEYTNGNYSLLDIIAYIKSQVA